MGVLDGHTVASLPDTENPNAAAYWQDSKAVIQDGVFLRDSDLSEAESSELEDMESPSEGDSVEGEGEAEAEGDEQNIGTSKNVQEK